MQVSQNLWFSKLQKPLLVMILFAVFLFQNIRLSENYHGKFGAAGVIWSDAYTYYEYLPALFIRKDVLRFKNGMPVSPGVTLTKVTYGVALLEAPFFLTNYMIQSYRGDVGNGRENSYGYSIIVANSVYAFLAFCMLFALFKKWFNVLTACVSVVGIYYGTNMFHYGYAEPGCAHVYSFFGVTGLLFFTDRFYANPKFGGAFLMATVFMALIVLVRPLNIFAIFIFALYGCYSWADFKSRFVFLFSKWWLIPSFALVGFIFFIPQMAYWHLTTGKWFVSAYAMNGEHFIYLTEPKIAEALFSHKGGWLPYSQIMIISLLALPFMIYKRVHHGWMILLVFLPLLYLCSSWWAINFMCAHGYRSFIDFYPLLILPFAWIFHQVVTKASLWYKIFHTVLVLLLIYFACCFNLDFSIDNACINENWTFYHYIKWYDKFI